MMQTQVPAAEEPAKAVAARRLPARVLLASMALVELLSGVTQGYLTPLLPSLGGALHITDAGQTRIYLLSQLAFAVWTPLLAKLGDVYGYRRLLRVSIALVATGSLLMAAWPSPFTLSVGVVLQAAVVGFMPLLIGILRYRAPEYRRSGIGLLVGVLTASVGVGGVVSGSFSEHSATLGLWVAVPVAVLAVVAGMLLPDGAPRVGGRLPLLAFTLLTIGLVGVVSALSMGGTWGWISARTAVSMGGGLLAMVAWVAVEARARTPLVDLRTLTQRPVAIVSGVTFCLAFSTIGFFGANAVFLGTSPGRAGFGLDYGPRAIALVALALNVFALGSSLSTAALLRRFGERRTLALSGFVIAASFLSLLAWHGSAPQYLVAIALLGIGFGGYQASTRALCVEGVPEQDTAMAAGINELALSFGAAIGASTVGAIMSAHQAPTGVTMHAYVWLWSVCAGVALIGTGLGLRYRKGEEHR
ncbi:MFS transporter [Streptomyces iconiensis]|uniref:MFS transporter n=1 Tax=Streptomyces iconiensis TaxID=1384038 RepID=A0ABT6ZZC0_9ACTN|nr:MFS transporter [Streptomyces iconiensis]MDJ1134202.1 MFS transporter [Streptomyces iconiensis]